MKIFSTLAILIFYVKADLIDSINDVVRSMNQHVLLQVKTHVLLQDDVSLSHEFEHFDSKSIPLQWLLQIDELIFDSTMSGSSQDSIRLDEQILEVKWNSTKTEDGWPGIAAYSLLLPLETSTRRSNRALLLAIWERDLETGSRRFLSQQLTHVPKTTPMAGVSSDKDYSWNPNTVIEMNIKSRHTRNQSRPSRSLDTSDTTSFGLWAFVAVSVAGLLHLWKGPRPNLETRSSVDECEEHDTESDMMETESCVDEKNEEASYSDYDDDARSLSPAFVLLRSSDLSSDESDDEAREEQDLILDRPPGMERRMKTSFLDEGISFEDALNRATENYMLEQNRRLKETESVGNEAVEPLGNDAISSDSSAVAEELNPVGGDSTCSSSTPKVGPRLSSQESPALLKLGNDFASFGVRSSPGLQTNIIEGRVNSTTKEVFPKVNLLHVIQTYAEPKSEDLVVVENNREEPDHSVKLQQNPESVALVTKQSKKRPRDMISSEEKDCPESKGVRDRAFDGSQTECINTLDSLTSKQVPETECKRSKGVLIRQDSVSPQSKAIAAVEQVAQDDAEDGDGRVDGTPSSFAPDGSLQEEETDCLETSQNDFLDKDSDGTNGLLGFGEQDDTASSHLPVGERVHTSQLACDDISNTQADEMNILFRPNSCSTIESLSLSSRGLTAQHMQADPVARALSSEETAPPVSPYTSTLPPAPRHKDAGDDAEGYEVTTIAKYEETIETGRNDGLDDDSNCLTGSLDAEEHDDAASSRVAAGEKLYSSQLAVGESSNTQVDEINTLCLDKRSTIESDAFCSPALDAESVKAYPVASALSFEAPAPPDSPYTSTLPPDSSSSYSDSSVDTLRNGRLEYTKTMLEKSAELRSVAGDEILADFVPSVALKTAAIAMKDFSFEFEGKGSKAKPLTLKELGENKSKRSGRARSFSDSLEISKSKQSVVPQHRSQRTISNTLTINPTVQSVGVVGENTPALKSMVSPVTSAKPVKRNRKTEDPSCLPKDSSRKRRISFNEKEKPTEAGKKTKRFESHSADPFDYNEDADRADPFAGKDDIRAEKDRAPTFR